MTFCAAVILCWGLCPASASAAGLEPFLKKGVVEAPAVGAPEALDTRAWVMVRAGTAGERTRLVELGMTVEEISGERVGGIADGETLQRVRDAGFEIVSSRLLTTFGPEDFPSEDQIYHNYDEVLAELSAAAADAPDLATVFSIGQSVQGRTLAGIRFHAPGAGPRPGIVFFGSHHAREHLSTEVPVLLARWMVDNRHQERVKRLLETRDIYIVPLVNPDGAVYDVATGRYRWQRKNMRDNGDGSVGVDLNRNFGFTWGGAGASANPGAETYRGPSAFSEPETQAVRDFISANPSIRIIVSYHTFSELILYPWGHVADPIPDGRARSAFQAMAQKVAGMTGYRPMQSSELYAASGDTCDWAWGAKKVFCLTFELTPRSSWEGGFYPGADAIASTFQANIEPALYLTDLADDPYRAGLVKFAAMKREQ